MSKKISGLTGLFLLVLQISAFAQGQGNSPYSVFGLGESADQTTASQDAMGGTGVSFANGFYINALNPALLVKNRVAGPYKYVALNMGLKGKYATIKNTQSQQTDFGMNLNNISMAFPIKKNMASGVVFQPNTIVDHKAYQTKPVTGSPTETVNYTLESTGGISKVGWLNSVRIGKPLYLGLEASYNFGTIFRDTTTSLSTTASSLLRNSNRLHLTGFGLKPAVAFQQKLSDKWQLNIGGTYEFVSNLSGENLRTFSTLSDAGNGPALTRVPDTLSIRSVSATLPSSYRLGISLESSFKWIFAAEYSYKEWSKFKDINGAASSFMQDAQEFNVGVEYVPNVNSTKYFNQLFYRFGYRQAESPYVINATRVTDRSFHLGISMPLGYRNPSYVDYSVSFGKRGTIANSLIQENYIKVGVNFSLLSNWFIQPKID